MDESSESAECGVPNADGLVCRVRRLTPTQAAPSALGIPHAALCIVPFAVRYMRQPVRADYFWAALCLVGPVYFMSRK